MKRKIFTITLLVCLMLSACGNKEVEPTPKNESTSEVVEEVEPTSTSEPIEEVESTPTPEVEETVVESTEEPEVVEPETPEFAYSHTWSFPDNMEGFTRKYLNDDFSEWSLNETHYVANDGTEMNFTWEGPASLGEMADAGESSLYLYGEDNYNFRAWNGGELKLEELEECLALEKSVWTSLSGSDVSYPEDGYYNIERIDNIVYVTYAVKTDTMNGYSYFICNGDAGNYYMFTYLERNEIYDDARALNVINSIDFWDDYTPLE